MSWIPVVLLSLLFAAAIVCLGYCLLIASGVRVNAVLSASSLLGLFAVAVACMISPWLGWSAFLVLAVAVGLCVAICLARCVRAGSQGSSFAVRLRGLLAPISPFASKSDGLCAGAGLACAIGFFIACLYLSGDSPSEFFQCYDAAFHCSVVRHIFETSNASPIGAGSIAGNATSVYPDMVHALAALAMPALGCDIQASIWVVELTFLMTLMPLGCFEVFKLLMGDKGIRSLPAIVAMALPVVLPNSVLSMIPYGPLYENALAYAVLPAAFALCVELIRRFAKSKLPSLAMIVAAFAALGFCHPNACFTLGIFLLPFIVHECGSRKAKFAVVGVAVAAWAFLYVCPFFKRTVNCDDRVESNIEHASGLFDALHLDYSLFASNEVFVAALFVIFLAVAVFASKALARRHSFGLYVFGLLFTLAQFAVAYFPMTLFARFVTGFWYMHISRFAYILVTFLGPLVAVLIALVALRLRERVLLGRFFAAVMAVGLVGLMAVQMPNVGSSFSAQRINEDIRDSGTPMFDAEDAEVFQAIKGIVGDCGVINGYNDCTVWAYATCGLNATERALEVNHLSGTDERLVQIMSNLANLGDGSDQSQSLKQMCSDMGLDYVLQADGVGQYAISYSDKGTGTETYLGQDSVVTEETPGFQKVGSWDSSAGKLSLYRIDL